MFPEILNIMAEDLVAQCRKNNLMVTLAESCTGGLVAGCLTSAPGASEVFEIGFVTYANTAKHGLLGVADELLKQHGAVSEEVARAMAEGAMKNADADLAGAITGIAGPGGGTAEKPVGLVHMAVARKGHETRHEKHLYKGERERVRLQAAESILKMLNAMAGE